MSTGAGIGIGAVAGFARALRAFRWSFAGQLTPVAYILWSLWLAAIGVAFLV